MLNYCVRGVVAGLIVLTAGRGMDAQAVVAETKLAFPTNEQMRHYKAMGDPQLSPDGKSVLVRITDATADGAKSHIWLVDVSGGAARQLTFSPEGDKRGERTAQWMPDGSAVLFLAHRGEHTLLYRLPMTGGEAKGFELKVPVLADESKLPGALPTAAAEVAKEKKAGVKTEPVGDEVPIDVENFRIAPNGKTIALLVADPETPGEKKQKEAKADAEWVDHGLHRTRLYLVSVSDLDGKTPKLTEVVLPLDVGGAEWSEDSSKLVVVAEEPNGVDELGPAGSAWVVMAKDAAHPVKLKDVPATVGSATWSHDGGTLVYEAQAKRDAPPGYSDLYEYSLGAKTTRDLTDGFMGSIGRGEPVALVGGGVLEGVQVGVEDGLMRYAADGRSERVKVPAAVVGAAVTNASQSGWVFLGNSGGKPTELLYAATLGGETKVLALPELVPKGVMSIAPKRIEWKSDKYTIEGLLYLPPQAAAGKVPLVVDVHGGPLGAFSDGYESMVDYLLGQGWAVLRTNPRGSTGRGAEFAAANKNDLGGGDYRDIMAGVDYVMKTEPVDGNKMGLMGYSYGGEMAAFVEVKTNRFKGIVSMAPVIDQNSEYGTEKGSWYDQWYFGKPWLHEADAWRQSPLSGAGQAKTPFLLIQGQEDTTDPLGQSLEMYHALRQMGVAVDLVTYPRVDHGPLANAIFGNPTPEPWHGFDGRRRIVEFFEKAFEVRK
jgi:dipeptidyl aminopeptidase/acylaminoacyl peptidase